VRVNPKALVSDLCILLQSAAKCSDNDDKFKTSAADSRLRSGIVYSAETMNY